LGGGWRGKIHEERNRDAIAYNNTNALSFCKDNSLIDWTC
jgi:hypothetical protein